MLHKITALLAIGLLLTAGSAPACGCGCSDDVQARPHVRPTACSHCGGPASESAAPGDRPCRCHDCGSVRLGVDTVEKLAMVSPRSTDITPVSNELAVPATDRPAAGVALSPLPPAAGSARSLSILFERLLF